MNIDNIINETHSLIVETDGRPSLQNIHPYLLILSPF